LDVTPLPPTAELGLAENPLILALAPSANSPEQINAAHEIAAQLMERTGYVIVTIVPDSYADTNGRSLHHSHALSTHTCTSAYRNASAYKPF
jgi:hypothetical protein